MRTFSFYSHLSYAPSPPLHQLAKFYNCKNSHHNIATSPQLYNVHSVQLFNSLSPPPVTSRR